MLSRCIFILFLAHTVLLFDTHFCIFVDDQSDQGPLPGDYQQIWAVLWEPEARGSGNWWWVHFDFSIFVWNYNTTFLLVKNTVNNYCACVFLSEEFDLNPELQCGWFCCARCQVVLPRLINSPLKHLLFFFYPLNTWSHFIDLENAFVQRDSH